MITVVKRPQLPVPKTLENDLDGGPTNYSVTFESKPVNSYVNLSVTSESNNKSIYEDPEVLTQYLRPYDFDVNQVLLYVK